ncbi:MAG: sugar ABC transporter substrate-binding protein [Candidatus Eremiobacteraeota bacterium]|nr:sugar ABC transporter substrate-binding protein [Candidatus Eremiobacteraeota bacterium]
MKLHMPLILTLLSVVFFFFMGGCAGKKQTRDKLKIAMVIQAESNPYFDRIEKGMRDAANDQNMVLVVIADREYQAKEQQAITKKLIDAKVQGLIMMPDAAESSKKYTIPLILEANRNNIPVVFIHAAIDEDVMKSAGASAKGVVTNDKKGGSISAADYLVRKLKGKGTVLVMEGGPGGPKSEESRLEGFLEVTKKYPQVKVLFAPPGNWRREDAFSSASKALKKKPHVDAIFTYSEPMLLGILDAVDSLKVRKPLIVGFDGTDEGYKLVKTGRIDALVDQKPYEMGKASIDYMVKLHKGQKLPEVHMINTALITKESFQHPFDQGP